MQPLDLGRQGQHRLLAERLAHDLQTHRQPVGIEPARHRRDRKTGETQHEGGRDPIHVRLHFLAGHGLGIVLVHRKGRNRHARRDQVVELPEELAEQVPHPAARRFRGAEVARGRVEPGPNVTCHVGSEPVQLVHPWKHLRDEPQPAQREECPPTERQIELDFVDFDAELAEPDGGATAHRLDGRVDPDPGDIGAVGDPQAWRQASGRRGHEVAAGSGLSEGGERARARHGLQHQRHVLGGARHGAFDLKGVPRPVRRIGRNEPDRRSEPDHAAERRGNPERPAQVRPFGERDHAGDEPSRAAACRAAGAARRIPRVARAAEHLVEGVPTGGELGTVRLPEDHGARVPQPADDQGILGGYVVPIERGAVRRTEPGDRGHVLDADGQAREQTHLLAAHQPQLQVAGVVERPGIERDDGVDGGVVALDARQARLDDLDGRDFARPDEPRELGGGAIR